MWRRLGIEPGEGRVFGWGALALFMLGWTDVSLKNVSETFFLKRVGVELLPLVFLANSMLLVATTWYFGFIAARRDRLRLLPQTIFLLALTIAPLWLLVLGGLTSGFALLVIASKQITSIILIAFWMAMGDLLHGRQAKRLFAPMMAGVTLGTILGSFASGPLGNWLGIPALLPLSLATLLVGGLATLPLRDLRPRLEAAGVPLRRATAQAGAEELRRDSFADLWRGSTLFRLLCVVILCSGLLAPMLYFQFQYVADLATAGEGGEQRLLSFYSAFRGWISVAVLAMQLLVAGELYKRIGIPLATALSPVVYLLGFFGLSVRLSLPAGVGAMAAIKLQDNGVYDPALRVLYNLFPEEVRPRATAIFEGPFKRAGNALGNVVILAALQIGSAAMVGFSGLPIAGAWLVAALVLWRRYPRLLLAASASRSRRDDVLDGAELLDPATLRVLVSEMCSEDPERTRVALELVCEARPERAVRALAEAAEGASQASRPMIVGALDRVLERAVTEPVHSPEAARRLQALIAEPAGLSDRDRADLVQAYGRLIPDGEGHAVLESALQDASAAVRLAALAALHRRGTAPAEAPALDAVLELAAAGEDAAARRTAREEYRALLLCGEVDETWERRLAQLAAGLAARPDRADTAEALAEVAARHGSRAAAAAAPMLSLRSEPDARIRAALLRYCGHARLLDQAGWLVDHVGSDDEELAAAAREGLAALGPMATDVLLREMAYGKRSKRLGILAVLRELHVRPDTLRVLLDSELDAVQRDLAHLLSLGGRPALALLQQRLEERVAEQLHTALLFLATMHGENRIAQLGEWLRTAEASPRHRAILLEALESLLPSDERVRILPFLEHPDPARTARSVVSSQAVPPVDEALRILRKDPEELTRMIAHGLSLAAGVELEDHDGVETVEKVLHLKKLPMFAELTARQLMDLAGHVRERALPGDAVVVRQGEYDDCLYLVVEGGVHILRGDTLLAEIGAGGFFGEIALFEGIARTATAVTRGRTRLLALERGDMIQLVEEMPGIAITLLETMSRRVRELTDRLMV